MRKYASFSLIFGALLTPYYIPGTTVPLENLFLLFNIVLFLCNNKFKPLYYSPKGYISFLIYALVVPILGFLYYGNIDAVKSSYVSIILFTCSFVLYVPLLEYKYVKKYYLLFVVISSIIFLLQELMYNLVGFRYSAIVPFLPVRYSYTTTLDFITQQMFAPRSQSLFLEPAHFAQFLLGYLAIILGENAKAKRILSLPALFLSIILLLTWSGNAIILTALLWIIFIVMIKISLKLKYFIILPCVLVCILFSFYYLSSTEKGEHLLERTEELKVEQERLSSGAIRIYRGFFVFGEMPLLEKITGVGSGVTVDVIEHSPFFFMFYDFERYLNNSQMLLIGYGAIGTLLFGLFLRNIVKYGNEVALLYVALFIGMCFIEYFWGNIKMLMYLSISSMFCFRSEKKV